MTWQPIETWLPVYLWGLFSLHSKCTTSIIMASRHHFEACDEESATFPAQRWRWVLRRCKVSCATLMWLEELGRGGDTVLIRLGAGVVKGAIVVVRPYDLLCSWNTGHIYIYVYRYALYIRIYIYILLHGFAGIFCCESLRWSNKHLFLMHLSYPLFEGDGITPDLFISMEPTFLHPHHQYPEATEVSDTA